MFTYTIDTAVPTGAHAFEITDTLEDVLTFEGDVTATLDDKAISADQIKIDGQTVTVKLTKEQVRKQAGKAVHVEFSAKVKDGANLTPYMTDGKTSIPNTASYIINNNPDTKKDSNTVPVVPPTPNEPGIDKKINRDLTHLDIEENKSYMYNVTADIPSDIATYKEFVVTDTLESVLAINGDVVAYVDGYATDAIKVDVTGHKVTATVKDFAKLVGYKHIQLYIPAYIKADADLSTYGDNKVPNTARLDFTDSNGVKKNKETEPVTVTPPGETPPTPVPPKEPTPDEPRKTVSLVDGLEQAEYLKLPKASQNFRFDIKSVVPEDQSEDNRAKLSSITITDTLDSLLTVKKDNVFVKITGDAPADANYIDEDVEKAEAKLKEIEGSANGAEVAAKLEEAKKAVADFEAKLEADKAALTVLKESSTSTSEGAETTDSTDTAEEATTEESATTNNSEAIAAQEQVIADDEAQLATAKATLTEVQSAVSAAKTNAELKVELENQQKVVDKKQAAYDKAKDRQDKLVAALAEFAKVNDRGELTAEAIRALGGRIDVVGQTVTVDFSDEYTMEALKGYTVNVIIYSNITDVTALTDDHYKDGIDNIATVTFNHDPSDKFTKKTNKVTVVPPKTPKEDKPPTPKTPDKPKGDLPDPKKPHNNIPPANTPTTSKKLPNTLPKTGEQSSALGVIGLGLVGLGTLAFYVLTKKKRNP